MTRAGIRGGEATHHFPAAEQSSALSGHEKSPLGMDDHLWKKGGLILHIRVGGRVARVWFGSNRASNAHQMPTADTKIHS